MIDAVDNISSRRSPLPHKGEGGICVPPGLLSVEALREQGTQQISIKPSNMIVAISGTEGKSEMI